MLAGVRLTLLRQSEPQFLLKDEWQNLWEHGFDAPQRLQEPPLEGPDWRLWI